MNWQTFAGRTSNTDQTITNFVQELTEEILYAEVVDQFDDGQLILQRLALVKSSV